MTSRVRAVPCVYSVEMLFAIPSAPTEIVRFLYPSPVADEVSGTTSMEVRGCGSNVGRRADRRRLPHALRARYETWIFVKNFLTEGENSAVPTWITHSRG